MRTLVLLSVLLLSSVGFARQDFDLESGSSIDIKLSEDAVGLRVHYPGKYISKLCAIEIKTTHGHGWRVLVGLFRQLRVQNYFLDDLMKPKFKSHSAIFGLAEGTYVDGIVIAAPAGKTVKEVATALIKEHGLTASAVPCSKR